MHPRLGKGQPLRITSVSMPTKMKPTIRQLVARTDGIAALRGHYAGYADPVEDQYNSATFGIIKSMDVYHVS